MIPCKFICNGKIVGEVRMPKIPGGGDTISLENPVTDDSQTSVTSHYTVTSVYPRQRYVEISVEPHHMIEVKPKEEENE